MDGNIGAIGRYIRIVTGMIMICTAYSLITSEPVAEILVLFSLILIMTAVIGYCPIYSAFDISTLNNK